MPQSREKAKGRANSVAMIWKAKTWGSGSGGLKAKDSLSVGNGLVGPGVEDGVLDEDEDEDEGDEDVDVEEGGEVDGEVSRLL